jgi:hypothetical protein
MALVAARPSCSSSAESASHSRSLLSTFGFFGRTFWEVQSSMNSAVGARLSSSNLFPLYGVQSARKVFSRSFHKYQSDTAILPGK